MTSSRKRIPGFLLLPIAALSAVAVLAAACGGGDEETTPPTTAAAAAAFDISLGDNFFDPKTFTVKAGQEVKFTIKNNGVAIHNMRFAGDDNTFDNADDVVSKDVIIKAGQSSELEMKAPAKAGTYNLKCDFHPVESTGTITVK
ncbi:MAG: cupredoxin domain-containing protein [Dehalococcoidia bacterium]|nr:cupredoxin domain-containing protein [Dehalococcoidia bacterium]